jgi:hypothetical protein
MLSRTRMAQILDRIEYGFTPRASHVQQQEIGGDG